MNENLALETRMAQIAKLIGTSRLGIVLYVEESLFFVVYEGEDGETVEVGGHQDIAFLLAEIVK